MTPTEPTLTCSEVVERLAACFYHDYEAYGQMFRDHLPFDREAAEKILNEWRERRVQELEEALRQIASLDYKKAAVNFAAYDAVKLAEKALAKSDEWREQIRKGAKHE